VHHQASRLQLHMDAPKGGLEWLPLHLSVVDLDDRLLGLAVEAQTEDALELRQLGAQPLQLHPHLRRLQSHQREVARLGRAMVVAHGG